MCALQSGYCSNRLLKIGKPATDGLPYFLLPIREALDIRLTPGDRWLTSWRAWKSSRQRTALAAALRASPWFPVNV
jgi:hypothetical protein